MNFSEYVFHRLADLGVKHVFVLPGGGCMHLVDALGREARIAEISLLHEQSVGVAADAYAQITNNLGVALVTTGPGSTNAVTAVAAAWLDSTPCMFISGQVKTVDLVGERGLRQFGFQEIDITSIVSPITKYTQTPTTVEEAVAAFENAIVISKSGRPGPVWLDVPLDIQATKVPVNYLQHDAIWSAPLEVSNQMKKKNIASADLLAVKLSKAKRPLFLIGNGVRIAQVADETVSLARKFGIPVMTTWKSLDLISDEDPLYAGRPGGVGSMFANRAIQQSDVVICIGARLDLGQVGYRHDTFAKSAETFVVDIDPAELAKLQISNLVTIESDAGAFVRLLGEKLNAVETPDWKSWMKQIDQWKYEFPLYDSSEDEWDDGLSLYSLVEAVSLLMRPSDVLAPGSSGACSEISMQAFRVKTGQRVMNSEGLGSMGFGVPGAIGACLASGGRRTICLEGDGGFAMNIQDLASVARLSLPITFIVLDNGGYGSIQATQDRYFEGRRVASDRNSGISLPNYRELEPVFGISVDFVENLAEFQTAFGATLLQDQPSIILAKVSPMHQTRFRVQTKFDDSGKPMTSELDELWFPEK